METGRVSAFLEANIKTIYAYALSRVSNKEDAEDLAGEIVLAILQSADRIRDENAFFGYIWSIAANTYKKYCRKRKSTAYTGLDETTAYDEDDIADQLSKADDMNRLRRELSILTKEYRECTVAYYINGLSCADTAKKLRISLGMVKYYLFKTRKILKEGIGMEREFGEKSYRPSNFEFVAIISGQLNREYQRLFHRKLPGNILVSTYYTPMTLRELAIELGVASVYLEDEIELLEQYKLLTALPNGKYQANLVIFTEGYDNELIRTAEKACRSETGAILRACQTKLPRIRSVGFSGCEYSDERLIWAFLAALMREGYVRFEDAHPKAEAGTQLYHGATGVYFGIDYEAAEETYACHASGRISYDDRKHVIFADFGILPGENQYRTAQDDSHAPVLTEKQLEMVYEILSDEINGFAKLYEHLSELAIEIMRVHAPRQIGEMIEDVIQQTLFVRTLGLIGALAVHSGGLSVPEDASVKPVIVIEA